MYANVEVQEAVGPNAPDSRSKITSRWPTAPCGFFAFSWQPPSLPKAFAIAIELGKEVGESCQIRTTAAASRAPGKVQQCPKRCIRRDRSSLRKRDRGKIDPVAAELASERRLILSGRGQQVQLCGDKLTV